MHTEEIRGAYRVLVGKPKRPLGRPRHRWEGNATMVCKEISCESVNWVDRAQEGDKWHAVVNVVMNRQFPYNVGNLLSQGTKLLKKKLCSMALVFFS